MSELAGYGGETDACNVEEIKENVDLRKKDAGHKQQDEHRVDGAFGNDGSERFGQAGVFVAVEDAATDYLSDARHDEAGGVRKEYSFDADRPARMLSQRFQCLMPPQTTQNLSHNARNERKQHPLPFHVMKNDIADARK